MTVASRSNIVTRNTDRMAVLPTAESSRINMTVEKRAIHLHLCTCNCQALKVAAFTPFNSTRHKDGNTVTPHVTKPSSSSLPQ